MEHSIAQLAALRQGDDVYGRDSGRIIQSSGRLRLAIVNGMNVRDSRVHNFTRHLTQFVSAIDKRPHCAYFSSH
jgi:hypothetical protein